MLIEYVYRNKPMDLGVKMLNMAISNIKVEGKAIVDATITNVPGTDGIQAEYYAENFLATVAADSNEVVSCALWSALERTGDRWVIRFHN